MNDRLFHYCKTQGCPERIQLGAYCEVHQRERDERRRVAQNNTRGVDYQFYKSKRWRELRAQVLRANPTCSCGARATMVDHARTLQQGGDRFDPLNLQAMCDRCHNRKRQIEMHQSKGRDTQYDPAMLPAHLRRRGD